MAKYKRRPKVKRYRRSFYSRGMRIRKIVGIVVLVAVVLAAAALLFVLYRANAPKAEPLVAVVDFGDGITETIPLDEDHDYLYDVGDYIVHLQVKDGAIAFLDSQCPDHVCEQFGWLDKDGAWAACVPAGVYVVVEPTADAGKKE